ncbi:MAG: hypothetical protein V2J24_11510, partial [Pseudomonadales bacterium]|nr:hypothetical protein [Pseudomonadales bacterium]
MHAIPSRRAAGLLLFGGVAFAAGWFARGGDLSADGGWLAGWLRDGMDGARRSTLEFVAPSAPVVDCAALWRATRAVPARVEAVIDGDSLRLRIDGRSSEVRLQGIDAPEWN